MNPEITIAGDRLSVHFDSFGPAAYKLFLRVKALPEQAIEFHRDTETYTVSAPARFASLLGVQVPKSGATALPLAPFLKDDQKEITSIALAAKRFACWSGCGQGKTLIGLELARHVVHRTGGRVLIVTRNEIVNQWIEEAETFYKGELPLHRIKTRQEMRDWCRDGPGQVGITNYEKWNPENLDCQVVSEAKHLAGIILDESNRLAASGGKQKWALIKSCRGIEYKLSLTATPAPNDTMEFASQASFLEKMRSEGEIIWTYFCRDSKTHRWTVKRNAREAFFRFMASWSIYVNDPKRFSWRLDEPDVPPPTIHVHEIAPTEEQLEWAAKLSADAKGQMALPGMNDQDLNAIRTGKLSQVAKGFVYRKGEGGRFDDVPSRKPDFVTDLIRSEVAAGHQVLVWTVFNVETEILAKKLAGAAFSFDVLTGKTKEGQRVEILDRFRIGKTPVLISRADMIGFGMNFQCCTSMVFSGWTFSFVSFYQSVRRAYRYGQTKAVRVHLPVIKDLEGEMLDTIFRKEAEHAGAIEEMEQNYIAARETIWKGVT